MARKYTRKHVNSLKDLDLEQERIKLKMRRLEDDVLGIVNPQQLAISLIGSWLKRRGKRSSTEPAYLAGDVKRKKLKKTKSGVSRLLAKPAVKNTAKKIGISFLRWQAFNLAWFLGKKLYTTLKHRKRAPARLPG
ncbi:hypothetical protein [Taibaiella helva]|uniref:hypothetical protein n=1 Tax=Taibaiella helva TaxID=2301235 RepID=UPI000E58670A|nr:hypothetical protein [Taibaiella helva]